MSGGFESFNYAANKNQRNDGDNKQNCYYDLLFHYVYRSCALRYLFNSSAKLKQGRIITHGTYFPDDGLFSHAYEKYIENEDQGLSVSDIRIIDVYGFKCSVIFIYNENQQLYIAEDYPLSNLDYNVIEVISANDLMKADLHNNYTLRGAPSAHMPRILIILVPVLILVVFVALHIGMLKKKYQREKYEG